MIENKYNLLDENWIPVVGVGKVGLKRIFSDSSLSALGGNPIEKIAVFKLLLAIAQTACTPKDEDEWKSLGRSGMQEKVLEYLDSHRDCFWLYGEKPFLQVPEIADEAHCSDKKKFAPVQIGNGKFPDLYADNNTVVSEYDYLDITNKTAELALFLITVQNFALRGKQVNNKIKLADEMPPKSIIANPGPSLGFNKFLHSFILLDSILGSIYLNLFSMEDLDASGIVTSLGIPFWEKMPKSENDEIAKNSKDTLLGHLIPMSRFVYFTESGIFFTEGITYHLSKEEKKKNKDFVSWKEFSISWKLDEKNEMKYLSADVSKRPWRLLTSLLVKNLEAEYQNLGIRIALKKLLSVNDCDSFIIWSGGLDVGGDSFGMKIKENNDYVESELLLQKSIFSTSEGFSFFKNISNVMAKMNNCEGKLEYSVSSYFMELQNKKLTDGKARKSIIDDRLGIPKQEFWQLCEGEFQNVIDICSGDNAEENLKPVLKKIRSFVSQIYDETCPKDTARQMEAWAKNKPFMKKSKIEEER